MVMLYVKMVYAKTHGFLGHMGYSIKQERVNEMTHVEQCD